MAGEESQSITDFSMVGATIDFLQYGIRGAIIPKFREEYNNYQDRIKRLVKKI